MALERATARFHDEDYEEKKARILAGVNPATERIVNGVIYCKRCHQPKMYDDPTRPFVVKCCCDCEVEAWERRRKVNYSWLRNGDFNPFDK